MQLPNAAYKWVGNIVKPSYVVCRTWKDGTAIPVRDPFPRLTQAMDMRRHRQTLFTDRLDVRPVYFGVFYGGRIM